jgi:two-component system sensor histidine kinase ChvG
MAAASEIESAAPEPREAAPPPPEGRIEASPLTRRIVLYNALAILSLVLAVLFLDPSRDGLVQQREEGLVTEALLIAGVYEGSLPGVGPVPPMAGEGVDAMALLAAIDLPRGVEVHVFDPEERLVAQGIGDTAPRQVRGLSPPVERPTPITTALRHATDLLPGLGLGRATYEGGDMPTTTQFAAALIEDQVGSETLIRPWQSARGPVYSVATPIRWDGARIGYIVVTTRAGEIEYLVRVEREQVLQLFVIALAVSIVLSVALASTIANPLSDLSAAAELGHEEEGAGYGPQRIRIPDLSARPDEIGRLSRALRGMVAALYDRIDANEQFAADVAHEIKNPLASLRSAVGTLRVARADGQRARLLEVIEHDVRRLDRLVSDISNASRLDSELVKEEQEEFDLVRMVSNLCLFHAQEAEARDVAFITDLPNGPVPIRGLEARLAQVVVNLVTNALSFCEAGDAVRVWMRRRDARVLVVVEDTGPGIPEPALAKVFERFYSERPETQFGDHSGLGLHISRQIVEAHGGVIWAENIRPTEHDPTSEPLGDRFVVGLPV